MVVLMLNKILSMGIWFMLIMLKPILFLKILSNMITFKWGPPQYFMWKQVFM